MRIAILIGVASYEQACSLPAAESDVTAMESLLRATGRFSEIIPIKGRVTAEECKTSLFDRFQTYTPDSVEEVLFYFSGHGDLLDDGLIFPMSDFSDDRRRQTSIQNSELDDWLKSLSPRVAVKILDCCHAGTNYVKGVAEFKAALDVSTRQFTTCYFLFSSQREQSSYADDRSSFFTRALLSTVKNHADGPLRYRELIDSLADKFDGNRQQPQFVSQGNMRDLFCEVNDAVRSSIPASFFPQALAVEAPAKPRALDIREAVEHDSRSCIPKSEAEDTLLRIRERTKEISFTELEGLYEFNVYFGEEFSNDTDTAGEEIIGKWLNNEGGDFFARPTWREPRKRSAVELAVLGLYAPEEKRSIDGFVTTDSLQYDRILIRARPKFQNLSHWELALVFLWSTRAVVMFHYSIELRADSWDRQRQPEIVKWTVYKFKREQLSTIPDRIEGLAKQFDSLVQGYLRNRFMQPTISEKI